MKYITITILFCIALLSCTVDTIHDNASREKQVESKPNYNEEKDKWLNSILDQKPLKTDIICLLDNTIYTLWYDSLKIIVAHYLFIPYEQKEDWYYFPYLFDGRIVNTDGSLIENKVSDLTLKRMRDICLSVKQTFPQFH